MTSSLSSATSPSTPSSSLSSSLYSTPSKSSSSSSSSTPSPFSIKSLSIDISDSASNKAYSDTAKALEKFKSQLTMILDTFNKIKSRAEVQHLALNQADVDSEEVYKEDIANKAGALASWIKLNSEGSKGILRNLVYTCQRVNEIIVQIANDKLAAEKSSVEFSDSKVKKANRDLQTWKQEAQLLKALGDTMIARCVLACDAVETFNGLLAGKHYFFHKVADLTSNIISNYTPNAAPKVFASGAKPEYTVTLLSAVTTEIAGLEKAVKDANDLLEKTKKELETTEKTLKEKQTALKDAKFANDKLTMELCELNIPFLEEKITTLKEDLAEKAKNLSKAISNLESDKQLAQKEAEEAVTKIILSGTPTKKNGSPNSEK